MKPSLFFSGPLDRTLRAQLDALPDAGRSRHSLLCGPPRSGKTSLLFNFACNVCLQNGGGNAVIICKRQKLEASPPLLPPGADIQSDAYEKVALRYLSDGQELRKYLACLHLSSQLPSLIIVDDFYEYCSEDIEHGHVMPREMSFAKMLALLNETVNQISDMLGSPRTCELLISDVLVGDSPRLLYIYKRWIAVTYTIQDAGEGLHKLQQSKGTLQEGDYLWAAIFSMSQGYLTLREVQTASGA